MAMSMTVLIALCLGLYAASKQNSSGDLGVMTLSQLGLALPNFWLAEKNGALRLVAAPDSAQGAVHISADARMYAGCFDAGQSAALDLDPTRKAYVQVLRGTLRVNGQALSAGDALLIEAESRLLLDQGQASEVLVFDLCA